MFVKEKKINNNKNVDQIYVPSTSLVHIVCFPRQYSRLFDKYVIILPKVRLEDFSKGIKNLLSLTQRLKLKGKTFTHIRICSMKFVHGCIFLYLSFCSSQNGIMIQL